MTDDDALDNHAPKERPVEGHVAVPGSGLLVRKDCLGRSVTSRIALDGKSYDLTIELPQLDPTSALDGPLIEPGWAFGPSANSECANIRWGQVTSRNKDQAQVFRCRYNTAIPPSEGGESIDIGWEIFKLEFEVWWKSFTSWAAILASQDIVGPPDWDWSGPDLEGWIVEPHGLWGDTVERFVSRAHGPTFRVLELKDLEACVTAAGNHGPPPVEWQLIRDARSHANTGDEFTGRENFRRAVIDAAAAAELAIPALMQRYLHDASVLEPLRKALITGSDDLGGTKEVLNLLQPGLIRSQLQENLITKSNGASHLSNHYYWEEAEAAVDIATAVVKAAYPLAGYFQISSRPESA